MLTQTRNSDIPAAPLVLFLDTNGDGTGSKNGDGDYSAGVTRFFKCPNIKSQYEIHKLIIQYSTGGKLRQQGYGNAATPLTNGVTVGCILSNVTYSLTNTTPVTTNDGWLHLGYSLHTTEFTGGLDTAQVIIDFIHPIILDGKKNDLIYVDLNDNFTFLLDHTFSIHGQY